MQFDVWHPVHFIYHFDITFTMIRQKPISKTKKKTEVEIGSSHIRYKWISPIKKNFLCKSINWILFDERYIEIGSQSFILIKSVYSSTPSSPPSSTFICMVFGYLQYNSQLLVVSSNYSKCLWFQRYWSAFCSFYLFFIGLKR